MRTKSNYRWFIVAVFFAFMLLHQSDKLLIGPLTTPIMETFGIDEVQMGAVFTGALIVGAILYPMWGYLYDRFARSKLLALASFIWGSTTWLSAIAPTYSTFVVTRASTGIDDSSYPGLYSLISDYFAPSLRGKVYGLLQLSQPLGYMLGLLAATLLSGMLGWRGVFYITGSLGLVLALVIFLGVRETPRGRSEPELSNIELATAYRIEGMTTRNFVLFASSYLLPLVLAFFIGWWALFFIPILSFAVMLTLKSVRDLLRKRSLILLFAQGFVGVFPWNTITYWFFRYLETERNYTSNQVLATMAPAILVLASGYFIGGAIGDAMFKRTPRGRVLTAMVGVLTGAILLSITMNVPTPNQGLFLVMLLLTAIFIPFASPNVISTVYDMSLPEVRSTALSIQYYIENSGAALAPLLAGYIAREYSLGTAILIICTTTWLMGAIFLAFTAWLVPADIALLRRQMRERAEAERSAAGA